MRRPLAGTLYEAFKNTNRNLPDEFKLRQRKKAVALTTVPVSIPSDPTPILETDYNRKGKYCSSWLLIRLF